jgi:two-component system, cell cycle response regulator
MRVLVVENDPTLCFMLEQLLQKAGHESVVVETGQDARQILKGADAPRFVIADHDPPRVDAVALCETLRSSETARRRYFVALAPSDSGFNLQALTEAGIDDFVAKPFQAIEVEVRVRAAQRIFDLEDQVAAAEEARREQATRDALTGTLNRGAALDLLGQELARGAREASPLAVVTIKVDDLKQVNDWHGHSVGDGVLIEVVNRLRRLLRVYDGLGRSGGDEFLAILPRCEADAALLVADRMRASVAATPVESEGRLVSVTASVGVATGEVARGVRADRLAAAAAAAARRARSAGGDRVDPTVATASGGPAAE